MGGRAKKLIAVVRGVDPTWFRAARALVAYYERGDPGGPVATWELCRGCGHPDHAADLCGAPKRGDGGGVCLCALERSADGVSCGTATVPEECSHDNMTASVCGCPDNCPCQPCQLPRRRPEGLEDVLGELLSSAAARDHEHPSELIDDPERAARECVWCKADALLRRHGGRV